MSSRSDADPLFGAPYKVLTHEHLDDEWATVTIRCIGVPTKGIQPVEWPFALKVPKAELGKFPLGGHVRLAVTA